MSNGMNNLPVVHARTTKVYACARCGCEKEHETNHEGPHYSIGRYNCCPNCPPWAKFADMGGSTVWNFVRYPERRKVSHA